MATTLIQYDASSFEILENKSFTEIIGLIKPNKINWLQVEGVDNLEQIGKHFKIHPLFLEDITTPQRPKLDAFKNQIYIVTSLLELQDGHFHVKKSQISLIVIDNILISFSKDNSFFTPIKPETFKENPIDFLLYSLIDLIVDHSFSTLDQIDQYLTKLEGDILQNPSKQIVLHIQSIQKLITILRNTTWPTREAVQQLQRLNSPTIQENTKFHLNDVLDHLSQALDIIENFSGISSSLIALHASSLNQRLNEIIRILTVFSTIFIPLTFVTSFYGMNFHHMPELEQKWSYPIVIIILLGIAGGMLLFFRRKKWI